jgi:hypothetical protein
MGRSSSNGGFYHVEKNRRVGCWCPICVYLRICVCQFVSVCLSVSVCLPSCLPYLILSYPNPYPYPNLKLNPMPNPILFYLIYLIYLNLIDNQRNLCHLSTLSSISTPIYLYNLVNSHQIMSNRVDS